MMTLVAAVVALGSRQRAAGCGRHTAHVLQHTSGGHTDMRLMRRPRLLRRTRWLGSALAVFVALVALRQISMSPAMCGPNIRASSQPSIICTKLPWPHERLGRRCALGATGDIVQVFFDNSWIDVTVDCEATTNIKVSFQLDGYEYGMVTDMWRKRIKPEVEGPPPVKPDVKQRPPIKHPMKDLRCGQKLEGVVINNSQRAAFINISSEFPGIVVHATMPSLEGPKRLKAGDTVDVWIGEDPNKVATFKKRIQLHNGTIPLTLMDYKAIEECISSAEWLPATVSGFDSDDDAFVSVPVPNAHGFNLTGIVPWEARKQDLDDSPVLLLKVDQHVKVRITDVSKATGKVGFSMIPRKDPQEFLQLINTDIWLDGEVVKVGPFGLVVRVAHPESGQLATGLVRMSEWRPMSSNYDDMLRQKVRVRVTERDAKKESFFCSMLPKCDISQFKRVPPDLYLNATVSGIKDIGLLVLADPPSGSSSGPYTILVPPDQIPESASGTGYAATRSNSMSEEDEPSVASVVTLHTDLAASQSSASSATADPAAQMRFGLGDNVKVRVIQVRVTQKHGTQMFGSLREVQNTAMFKHLTDTDWLDAVVTGYVKLGVEVDVTPTNGGPPERGVIRLEDICMGFCSDPSTEVSIGEEVQVRVVSADRSGLFLSMVQKQEVEGWSAGSNVFSGIVTDVGEQGALVSVRPIDGHLPVQGMLPAEAIVQEVTLGQQVSVRVQKVFKKTGKVELSMATGKDIGSGTAMSASPQTASRSSGKGSASKSMQMEDSSWVEKVGQYEEMTARLKGQTEYGLFLEVQENTHDGSQGRVSTGLLHVTEMKGTIEEVAELAKSNQLKVRINKGRAKQKNGKLGLTMKA